MANTFDLNSFMKQIKDKELQENPPVSPSDPALVDALSQILNKDKVNQPSLANDPSSEPSLFSRVSNKIDEKELSGEVGNPLVNIKKSLPSTDTPVNYAANVAKPMNPYGSDLGDDALARAQASAADLRFAGQLANAGSTIGAAFSRGAAKPVEIGKDLIEGADIGAKNILQRREGKDKEGMFGDKQAMRDPNSEISKSLLISAKKLGFNFPPNTSAQQLHDSGMNLGTLMAAQARKEERLESAALRNQMTKDSKSEKAERDAKLSDKQVAQVSAHEGALKLIDNLIDDKAKFDTGPIAGRAHTLASMVGMGSPEKAAFKSDVVSGLASYIKEISGTAVNKAEYARLLTVLPNMEDNDSQFISKAKAAKRRLENLHNIELANFKKQGKNTKEFETATVPNEKGKLTTSNEDQEAIKWAKQNSSTPQGQQILKLHGIK